MIIFFNFFSFLNPTADKKTYVFIKKLTIESETTPPLSQKGKAPPLLWRIAKWVHE
jgi:hypothetical protein